LVVHGANDGAGGLSEDHSSADAIPYGCSIRAERRGLNVDRRAGRADNSNDRVEKPRLGVDKCGEAVAGGLLKGGAIGRRRLAEFHKM